MTDNPPLDACAAQLHDAVAAKIDEVDDHVVVHILSYCGFADLGRSMRVNRRFRHVLATHDALWKKICQRDFWTWIKNPEESNFVLGSSVTGSSATNEWPLVLALALDNWHNEPTQMNEQEIRDKVELAEIECVQIRLDSGSISNDTNDDIGYGTAYRFTGEVGPGQRCIRANKPILRPKFANLWATSDAEWETVRLPFVCPLLSTTTTATATDKGATEIHLTPRWIVYFEVSMIKSQPPTDHHRDDERDTIVPRNRNRNHHLHRHHRMLLWQNDENEIATECTAIGLAGAHFAYGHSMPGWDRYSFGYHGDDGGLYHSTSFRPNRFDLPTFGAGDVVGCGVDYADRSIFFTKNGALLPTRFQNIDQFALEQDLYPVVGMDAKCLVTCNFGQLPFVFDLKTMTQKDVAAIERVIQQLPASALYGPPETDSDDSEEDDSEVGDSDDDYGSDSGSYMAVGYGSDSNECSRSIDNEFDDMDDDYGDDEDTNSMV